MKKGRPAGLPFVFSGRLATAAQASPAPDAAVPERDAAPDAAPAEGEVRP